MLSRHYSGNETSLFRLRLSTAVTSFTTTHDTTHHTAHQTTRRNTAQRYTQGTEVWKSIRQMPRFVHHDIHSTRLRAYTAWMGPCMRSDSSSILVITSTFHRRTRQIRQIHQIRQINKYKRKSAGGWRIMWSKVETTVDVCLCMCVYVFVVILVCTHSRQKTNTGTTGSRHSAWLCWVRTSCGLISQW